MSGPRATLLALNRFGFVIPYREALMLIELEVLTQHARRLF